MAPTLSPPDWGLHAPPMYQRNYAGDNFVEVYFGQGPNRSAFGPLAFRAQLFLSVLGSALELKSDIEQVC